MSSQVQTPESLPSDYFAPHHFREGEDRYVKFAQRILGLTLSETQKEILRSLATNQRTFVQSGNGVGKSFTAAVANLAFLFTNVESTNMATSGTYSVLSDVLWKPMTKLFKNTPEYAPPLQGRTLQNPPRLIIDDTWYFKAVSPTHPDNLEGRHAATMLITMEECDKPDITEEHFDSAGSMITDDNDRFLAISNPPRDETNVAYRKAQEGLDEDNTRWNTVQFSSFESHNVKIDAGEIEGEKIPGLVDLKTIKDDWVNWNEEPWPGYEIAKHAHDEESEYYRDDLDERWYRRRGGVMPPSSSDSYRPIKPSVVEDAWERDPEITSNIPQSVAWDVARMGGDKNVVSGLYGDEIRVLDDWKGVNHSSNITRFETHILDNWNCPIQIDAKGEGSGAADMVAEFYPKVVRYDNGEVANARQKFYNKWTEGLQLLGQFLEEGGSINDRRLYEELLATARTIRFEEKHYSSRGTSVLKADKKENVSKMLGHSPDFLDSAIMAVHGSRADEPMLDGKSSKIYRV